MDRCTCAATNSVGATGPGYRCHACSPNEEVWACDTCRPCDLCARELCEIHGEVDTAPTCAAHQECVDCVVDNRCRECAAARREGAA